MVPNNHWECYIVGRILTWGFTHFNALTTPLLLHLLRVDGFDTRHPFSKRPCCSLYSALLKGLHLCLYTEIEAFQRDTTSQLYT